MRNRRQTIEALRRLAERPGTIAEGKVARLMLERMAANIPVPKPFNASEFPRGVAVFYNYWAYPQNDPCVIVGRKPKIVAGEKQASLQAGYSAWWGYELLKMPRVEPILREFEKRKQDESWDSAKGRIVLTREFLDELFLQRLVNMKTHPRVGDLPIVKMFETVAEQFHVRRMG